jgi:hypothetical protein
MTVERGLSVIVKIQAKTALPRLKIVAATIGVAIMSGTTTFAQSPSITDMPITILQNQSYALCAGAIAWVFDNVAYANCTVLKGDSISVTLSYPYVPATNQPAGDIQTIANQGAMSGTFKVSTYSPPDSLLGGTRRLRFIHAPSVPQDLMHNVTGGFASPTQRARSSPVLDQSQATTLFALVQSPHRPQRIKYLHRSTPTEGDAFLTGKPRYVG